MASQACLAAKQQVPFQRDESVVSSDAVLHADDVYSDFEAFPAVRACVFLLHNGDNESAAQDIF
jgi:hypothetical protein